MNLENQVTVTFTGVITLFDIRDKLKSFISLTDSTEYSLGLRGVLKDEFGDLVFCDYLPVEVLAIYRNKLKVRVDGKEVICTPEKITSVTISTLYTKTFR